MDEQLIRTISVFIFLGLVYVGARGFKVMHTGSWRNWIPRKEDEIQDTTKDEFFD